MKLTHG
jgi:hypothetical protein